MKVAHKMLAPFAFFVLALSACNAQNPGDQANRTDSPTSDFTPNLSDSDAAGTVAVSASMTETVSSTENPTQTPGVEEKPLALIYKGPGSCSLDQGDAGNSGYGCSEASADVAILAGFRFKYVGPTDLTENATAAQVAALFGKAKVWIQPGGVSNSAYYAMTSKLRKSLVNFIQGGGGYVGFCAGAFLATDWFNIIDASSGGYHYNSARRDVEYAFLPMTWNGVVRSIYFEGGPYIYNAGKSVEVMSKFSTGDVQAARAAYGKGRVYISGGHPEAPAVWSEEDGIHDPDGSDLDIAAQMLTWSAGLSN